MMAGGSTVTHDARGNTTSHGTGTYGYDIFNRMTSAPGGAVLSYRSYSLCSMKVEYIAFQFCAMFLASACWVS